MTMQLNPEPQSGVGMPSFEDWSGPSEVDSPAIIMAQGSAAAGWARNGTSAAAKNAASTRIVVHRFQSGFVIPIPG
ncbi:MAG TPA: hypothetical protein VKZ79_24620 [Alphaproteobacteria bacterium]|nr:hypothetical protein [Alphaproteobacteria bacterium]